MLRVPLETNQMTTERREGKFRREIGSNLFRRVTRARFTSLLGIKNPSRQAVKPTKGRMNQDARAMQWLIENVDGSDEMEALLLAIPGFFSAVWGTKVWKKTVGDDQSTSQSIFQVRLPPSARQRPTVYELCRCVRNFFYAYNNEGDSMDTEVQQRRMRLCVETAASMVCCTRVELGLFGNVKEVLSKVLRKVGEKERTNDPLTIISNPLFAVRWTCLSLVAIWKMADANMLQELAKFALDGFARLHTDYGPDTMMSLEAIAERIDGYLMKAWAPVVDLHLAFDSEPWSLKRTTSDIITILNSHEESILELERIANEAAGVEDLDWRISFSQERMDGVMHGLMQRLPGVFFDKLKSPAPIMISEALGFPSVGTTPIPPRFIFPGQQINSLCSLGQRLRDIIEGQDIESHEETLKSLESLREIPVSYLGLKHLTKRQLWRLLDLRDGRGLGFTIELFLLAVRQLSSTPSPSELEVAKVLYTGTFEVITSDWEKSKKSAGTQRILLDILCDLVIRSRGVFSDFSYPPYTVAMLLDLVGKMVEGHEGLNSHINEVIEELEDAYLRNPMDSNFRDQALEAINLLPDSKLHSPSTPRLPASISAPNSSSFYSNNLSMLRASAPTPLQPTVKEGPSVPSSNRPLSRPRSHSMGSKQESTQHSGRPSQDPIPRLRTKSAPAAPQPPQTFNSSSPPPQGPRPRARSVVQSKRSSRSRPTGSGETN